MNVNKIKLETIERKTIIDKLCEKCKKSMRVEVNSFLGLGVHTHKAEYFDIKTSHKDWGNDSIDSVERCHLCGSCAYEFIEEYVKSMRDGYEIEIEKATEYFNYEEYDLKNYDSAYNWRSPKEYNEKIKYKGESK